MRQPTSRKQLHGGAFLQGRGRRRAGAALPRVAGAAARRRAGRRRRRSGSSCSSRSARSWSRSGTRASPATATAQGQQVRGHQQGRRHDAADAEAGAAARTTPGRRSPTSRRRPGSPASSGPALNPFLPKLTLIRGLDFLPAVNHNYGGLLGNFSSCTAATPCDADSLPDVPTIDQVMAYSPKVYPTTPGLRYLHISQGVTNSMSYSDLGMKGGADPAAQGAHQPARRVQRRVRGLHRRRRRRRRRPMRDKLLVDRVYADYTRLRQNSRLSGADKQLVDQYVTLVSELQAKLSPTGTPMMSCTPPVAPASMANNTGLDPTDITTKWGLFLDVVTAARHVRSHAHHHDRRAQGARARPRLGQHRAGRPLPLRGRERRHLARPGARLLQRELAPHAEGDQRLDRQRGVREAARASWTCPRWAARPTSTTRSSTGATSSASTTSRYSVPCLLAGSAGGFIKPGRYLDYIDWDGRAYFSQENGNVIKGIPHNQFLVTALQAMGLAPADYETRRQARLRLDQRQRPRPRRLGRRLRPVDGRPDPARHSRLVAYSRGRCTPARASALCQPRGASSR